MNDLLICPRCNSTKIKRYKYINTDCYQCLNCGYDTCSDVGSFPEQRTSQKEKGRYSPYKAGRK